jgi:hypothetical protein
MRQNNTEEEEIKYVLWLMVNPDLAKRCIPLDIQRLIKITL